jgi:hypothetical protein
MKVFKAASLSLLLLMGLAAAPKTWMYIADEPYCCQQDMGCCPGGACCNDNGHRGAQCPLRIRHSSTESQARPR